MDNTHLHNAYLQYTSVYLSVNGDRQHYFFYFKDKLRHNNGTSDQDNKTYVEYSFLEHFLQKPSQLQHTVF